MNVGRFSFTFFLTAKRNMNECCAAILIRRIKIMNEPRLPSRREQSPKEILLAVASLLQFLSYSDPLGQNCYATGSHVTLKKGTIL